MYAAFVMPCRRGTSFWIPFSMSLGGWDYKTERQPNGNKKTHLMLEGRLSGTASHSFTSFVIITLTVYIELIISIVFNFT